MYSQNFVANFSQGACEPIFGLLDLHEVPRHESYKVMLGGMKDMMLEQIKTMPPVAYVCLDVTSRLIDRLERLLPMCFAYISVPDLSAIPMAIMKAMDKVPQEFLLEIVANKELIAKCPLEVIFDACIFDLLSDSTTSLAN